MTADAATRARIAAGDEASIVNLLLFGTSFTGEPRVTSRQLNPQHNQTAIDRRIRDLERAIARGDRSERLQFARRVLLDAPSVRARLLSMIDRAMKEGEHYARLTEQAHALGDLSLEFAERSRVYRDRGLSSDTSVRINFAVEEALRGLTPVLARGSDPTQRPVRRVAVIGPGLDIADKQEGYDFYPPQTIQPFALIDSLIRLDLADAGTLQLTTLDVSESVNDHIMQLSQRALSGVPYQLHLPLAADVAWTPATLEYFDRFGQTIGSALPATIPPGIGPIRLRALSVRPSIASRIAAENINITAQYLRLRDDERFDLIVGTNIFVYYDRLQQGLAMASVAAMLRPGGILLSNNALVEVPAAGMRSIGYSKILYSHREEDGDVVVSYQKGIK